MKIFVQGIRKDEGFFKGRRKGGQYMFLNYVLAGLTPASLKNHRSHIINELFHLLNYKFPC